MAYLKTESLETRERFSLPWKQRTKRMSTLQQRYSTIFLMKTSQPNTSTESQNPATKYANFSQSLLYRLKARVRLSLWIKRRNHTSPNLRNMTDRRSTPTESKFSGKMSYTSMCCSMIQCLFIACLATTKNFNYFKNSILFSTQQNKRVSASQDSTE